MTETLPLPASPPALLDWTVRRLCRRLAQRPVPGRAGRKLAKTFRKLDRTLVAMIREWPSESAATTGCAELRRELHALVQRAAAAGISLGGWLEALMPEPTGIDMPPTPTALILIGTATLRSAIESGPLMPRQQQQLKAVLAAESVLRQIVVLEAADAAIPEDLIAAADDAASAIEAAIGGDIDDIFVCAGFARAAAA